MTRNDLREVIINLEYLLSHHRDPVKVEEYRRQLEAFRRQLEALEQNRAA